MTLYADGFTVNDGPFRPASDPANQKFIDDIQAGDCPAELRKGTAPVDVAVQDKRKEKYADAQLSFAQQRGHTS